MAQEQQFEGAPSPQRAFVPVGGIRRREHHTHSPDQKKEGSLHLPPKPKRRLFSRFSLAYTLLLVVAVTLTGGGLTWIVVTTPRWLAAQPPQQELSPEARDVLAAVERQTDPSYQQEKRAPAAVSSTSPQQAGQERKPSVRILSTETGWLNVREGPSTRYPRIGRVLPGEVYPFLEQQSGWYRIDLGEGKAGWVSGTYVREVER